MHAWFTASCNDKQQISQFIKLGIMGQQQRETAKVTDKNQYTLKNKHTHILQEQPPN